MNTFYFSNKMPNPPQYMCKEGQKAGKVGYTAWKAHASGVSKPPCALKKVFTK